MRVLVCVFLSTRRACCEAMHVVLVCVFLCTRCMIIVITVGLACLPLFSDCCEHEICARTLHFRDLDHLPPSFPVPFA
jgi:hypothetical protein